MKNSFRKYRNISLLLVLILSGLVCSGQGNSRQSGYGKLSRPEKIWVLLHPFSAGKAFRISMEALHVTDSLHFTGDLNADKQGGHYDAFKHAYWMARLTSGLGKCRAGWLGRAHERGNYLSYKKGKRKGYQDLHDKESSEMDTWNNTVGIETALDNRHMSRSETISVLLDKLRKGRMKILRKNKNGAFTDCEGNILNTDERNCEWESGKCLVPSDYQPR